jgi:hypothetical protein
VPFALYEYDAAYVEFFDETVRNLARARSPILSQMQYAKTSGPLGSRVRTRAGMDVILDPGEISTEVTMDLKAVRAGDTDALFAELDSASEERAKGLVGLFVQTMHAVTEGTGNVADAGGQALGFDVIYDMLERIDFSVDANDELVMPSLFVHPDTAAKLQALPPLTPDQESKLAELKERKREEALARRRRRRLS